MPFAIVVVFGKNTRKQPVAHHNVLNAGETQIKLIHYKAVQNQKTARSAVFYFVELF